MRDPLLITNFEPRIPDEWRAKYLDRAVNRLPADLIVAFDRIHKLQREKDLIQADLITAKSDLADTKRKLDRANLKIWFMSLIVSPLVTKLVTAAWIKYFPLLSKFL